MMKRMLLIGLSFLILLVSMPVGAVAAKSVTSGATGDCMWTLDAAGHLTISGDGAMAEYYGFLTPWGSEVTSVTIEEGVTTIGSCAFEDCNRLTSVSIPDSVTTIGLYAFLRCTALTSISIPASVTLIEDRAIEVDQANPMYCDIDGVLLNKDQTMLIQFPAGKTGAYTIPAGVIVVDYEAFCDCTKLSSVTIPTSVIAVKEMAFCGCTALTDVYYGGSDRAAIHVDAYNDELLAAIWHYDQATIMIGDLNGDVKVNLRDLGLLQQRLNSWPVTIIEAACDTTGDDRVNIRDLGRLQQYLNGWNVELAVK